MSCGCQSTGEQLCGCCAGVTQATPAVVVNRAGLSAIAYRVGTYSSFMETMLAALSGASVPALVGLRTRSSGDFSIALVDAWSEVLDILTFYTERLANEAYLGTAIEGRSVYELARLVGYQPSPGVSASTVLTFTLASAPGSPANVPIPAGTRVQSVPGPGQKPQVFETSADLAATIAANAIPASTTLPWQLQANDTTTWIAGTANNIHVGDLLLFIAAPNGNPTLSGPAFTVYVTAVQTDTGSGNTLISWDLPLPGGLTTNSPNVCLYLFRTKAALFGVAAPMPGLFPATTVDAIPGTPGGTPTNKTDWSWQYNGNQTVNLDSVYPGLNPPTSNPIASQLQWMLLTGSGQVALFQIVSATESNPALYALSAKTTQVRVSLTAMPLVGLAASDTNADTVLNTFVQATRSTTAYVQSQLLTPANLPATPANLPTSTLPPPSQWAQNGTYPVAPGMPVPVFGSSLTIAGLQPLGPNSPVGISGNRVRIVATSTGALFTPAGAIGGLTVSPNQAFLVDAFPPATDPKTQNLLWSVITVPAASGTQPPPPGQPGTLTVMPGQFQLQPSKTTDPTTGEAAIVSMAVVQGATTALTLSAELARIYDAGTVTVNANAVLATHGETVQEILGSGDATNAALQFQLKQSPLTYTASTTATGAQSTLQVRVNNLLWTEVPNFLESAPGDRAYVTRPNATGSVTVQFGSGIQGSRTPTGLSNLRALYRKGIGLAGMVAPNQLTQPLDRPQGLQSVTNPGAATGGADPASPSDARQSAPLPTLTLGRVVSLEDYQNFAIAYPGVGMALASWVWFGDTRGVLVTVAGAGGATVKPNDPLVQKLTQALQTNGLPYLPVMVVSYVPMLFEIGLQVLVDSPLYDPTIVIPQVWQSLVTAFAFGQLAPGQGVAASQVIRLAQQVPGVVAVNLTALMFSGNPASAGNILCASGPDPGANPPLGAQILSLDPASQGNVGGWS